MKNAAYLYKFRLKTEQNVNLVQDNWVVVQLPALPAMERDPLQFGSLQLGH